MKPCDLLIETLPKMPQCQDELTNGEGFCCLGVMTLLYNMYNNTGQQCSFFEVNDGLDGSKPYNQIRSKKLPDQNVVDFFGLYSPYGDPVSSFPDDVVYLESLSILNDDDWTFRQITDHLIKYKNYYFKDVPDIQV